MRHVYWLACETGFGIQQQPVIRELPIACETQLAANNLLRILPPSPTSDVDVFEGVVMVDLANPNSPAKLPRNSRAATVDKVYLLTEEESQAWLENGTADLLAWL